MVLRNGITSKLDIKFWDSINEYYYPINLELISSNTNIINEFLNFMGSLKDENKNFIQLEAPYDQNEDQEQNQKQEQEVSFFYKDSCTNYYSQSNNCIIYKISYNYYTSKISFISYNSSNEFLAVRLIFEINNSIYNALLEVGYILGKNIEAINRNNKRK